MNVMLISVALWSGAADAEGWATRDFFHWLSALVALPTVAYAGRPFFDSAMRALRQASFNMDVPITLGVMLALLLSVVQTVQHARETYFDSAVMLVLFLLAGRYLDQRMRRRTRDVATNLAAIKAEKAIKLLDDGEARETPIEAVTPGDLVLVRAGRAGRGRRNRRGRTIRGRPEPGDRRDRGRRRRAAARWSMPARSTCPARCACASATPRAARCSTKSTRCSSKAIEQRSSYVQLADRAARLYAPVVHLTALATFLGWLAMGLSWQPALVIAITVLIITCPCALGLAVPAVQVVAASAMFRRGVMLNSGDALERFADVDTIVFDKTGTLDAAAAEPRQSRRHRARGSGARRLAGAGEQASARQGGRGRGGSEEPARRPRIPRPGRHRVPRGQASQARLAPPIARPRRRRPRSRRNGRTRR